MADKLANLRNKIDQVDDKLVQFLNERASLAQQVGASKKGNGKFSPAREAAVVRRILKSNKGPMPPATVKAVFREVISGCLSLQQKLQVSYLGPPGTYSEEAVRARFGRMAELKPRPSLDEALQAAEKGGADTAVLPIENSSEGTVARTLDLLIKTPLNICDEILLPVHHQLLAYGSSLKIIKEVIAHPQALAQCRQWLAANLPQAVQAPASSNGEAALLAAERQGCAAIAGKTAADLYGLNILAENIEDEADNTTRFIVLGNMPTTPTGDDKTSLVCAAPNAPGALLKLLKVFADHNVSMVKLESRPAASATWEYAFYIDIEGHKDDAHVFQSLKDLKNHAAFVKILGSYPRA